VRHAILLLLLIACSAAASAQHLGARLQWQPQTESDPRLQQTVEIEIIGRAAVTGLPILSEGTGVSFSVAPEDLSTVGERKFSVFAHGCTLKDIMVQLCEALQECHWDVDWSGDQPVYLLHRNAGVDQTTSWLAERDAADKAQRKRAVRQNRLEEARAALAMSPKQLAELEKTDLLLARSVRDPHSRDLLEIVLSLPEAEKEQFLDTGRLVWSYAQAPERLQKAVQRIAEWFVVCLAGEQLADEVRDWRNHLGHATIELEDNELEHGWGVWLSLVIPSESGENGTSIHDVAVQPRYCNFDEGQYCYTRLLTATGTPSEEAAFNMTMDLDHSGFRVEAAKRDERRAREWVEPTDPDLLQLVTVGDQQLPDCAALQQVLAAQTGLSIISDYFSGRGFYLPDELRRETPLWRLLNAVGEDDSDRLIYAWRKAGRCITIYHEYWWDLSRREIPESLLLAYREKLKAGSQLTLDDIAAFAAALADRPVDIGAIPNDLAGAGLYAVSSFRWHLAFYASLSADQIAKARSQAGLPFLDMSIAQRQQVIARCARPTRPSAAGLAHLTTFHIVETVEERRGDRFAKTDLQLRFPGGTDGRPVLFRKLETPAGEPGAAKTR